MRDFHLISRWARLPSLSDRLSILGKRHEQSFADHPVGEIHHTGHRQRLRKRFDEFGDESLADYELLEMVLFRAIARRDTKPLAKALLKKFKNFSAVIHAPEHLLREVPGIGKSAAQEIALIRAAANRLKRREIETSPVLGSWDKVLDYCANIMGHETREQFRILFLDKRNRLITDECQQQGTVDHTPVYVREIVRRALELSATALILVHNHPSGDPEPSQADIQMTKKIVEATKSLNIVIHEHLIICRNRHFSFRQNGLL